MELQPTCVICGRSEKLEIDHVKPLSKGFGLEPGNVVILCSKCNGEKSDYDLKNIPRKISKKIEIAAQHFKEKGEQSKK